MGDDTLKQLTQQPKPETEKATAQFGAAIMSLMEVVSAVADGVVGYRNQLIAGGVGEQAADTMATQLHERIMTFLNAPKRGSTPGPGEGDLPDPGEGDQS